MLLQDWLACLPPLAPPEMLTDLLDHDDDPKGTAYRENLWLAHSVLRALHIEPEFKQSLGQIGIIEDASVLDVGCASGMKGRFLLDIGAASVAGIDNDAEELALAQKLPNVHGSRLRFLQSNGLETLPFADESFDVVLVADGHIDFYHRFVLDELQRVKRTGGHILFATTNLLPAVVYAHDRMFASRVEAARWATLADTIYADLAAAGTSYEARFLHACRYLNMDVWQVPIQRRNPVSPVFETLIQQTFACLTGPTLREALNSADWQHLHKLHDPRSDDYLFRRQDALFLDTLTLAVN
jgi:SAM-dependent methyltransferase